MSKRAHAAGPGAASAASSSSTAAAAAAPAAASKRVKFDDLVASGFGAEAFGGKAVTSSSVSGLALGELPPEQLSASRAAEVQAENEVQEYDEDGYPVPRASQQAPALTAEEEMERIMELVDSAPEVAELDAPAVRLVLQRFSKAAARNLEQRAKFPSQPEKFMDSEVALDESIHALQSLSVAAGYYSLLLESSTAGETPMETICNLIMHHENLDVAIDCIALLNELIDAETIGQEGEEIVPFIDFITGASAAAAASSSSSAAAAAASSSAAAVASAPSLFLSTIVSALGRFPGEHAKEQSQAVTHLLSILENLTDLEPKRVSTNLVVHTGLLEWCMTRMQDALFNQNKLYASEILSIVLTNAGEQGQEAMGKRVLKGMGIKMIIRYIAKYRKEDPSNSEEIEYLENLFDILCVCLHAHLGNQTAFAEHDGLQLMLTMIKRQTYAKNAAFKALDYAVQNCPASCSLLVELGGLKTIFGALMFNPTSKKDKSELTSHEQHLLEIITQLFLHCADTRYLRVLRKFQEQEMIKTERMVELLVKYTQRVDEAESKYASEHGAAAASSSDDSVERYARQSEHGLTHVELASIVLAFLATAGDQPLRERVEQLLNQQDYPLSQLQRTLRTYVSMMGDSTNEAVLKTKQVLEALAAMLQDTA